MAKNIEKWEVNSAVDTLIEAHEIMNNKPLYKRVKIAFAKKQRAMQEAALELQVADKQRAINKKK